MMSIGVMSAARTSSLFTGLGQQDILHETRKYWQRTLSLPYGWPSRLLSLPA